MGRKSSVNPKMSARKGGKRINWSGGHSKYIIKLFVKHFEKYNKNKLSTCRAWAEKMSELPQYEKLKLTAKQIKNFIATQITAFHRAMEKKDSTGFGDLDDATAEEQLMKICKFWYSRMPMYMTDFRNDLLPVLGGGALINPGAELNSDGLDELSDTDSESSDDSDLDRDANDSGTETSENDEEEEGLGQHRVKNKRGSTNTTSVNDDDSDIESDAPPKKRSKTESTKRSAKYTPISGQRKGSIIHDQFELKRIAMDIKREKVAIKKQKLEAEKQSKEYDFQLAREKLQLERMRIELQWEKTQSSHDGYRLPGTASPHSWMTSYNGSVSGVSEHDFTGSTV